MAADSLAPAANVSAGREHAARFLAARHRLRPIEALPWLLALAAFFVFPDRMVLGSQVLIMILFALSLDLILGFAGIVTLGHAAYFGVGAYTAGLLITRLEWTEPITGLLAAAACAAVAGVLSGFILLRYRGLALLVLTLSTTIMLQEVGNLFHDFTGGYDGIPGVTVAPLLGTFDYDLYGHTYYLYALAILFLLFFLVRRIVYSPFGRALAGIRENVARMHALGSPVHGRLVTAYAIAAAIAGVAGALFAQTNGFVTLGVFDFERSAGVMVMLILGGPGWLYGAFIGAVLYMVLENRLSAVSPEFWQFGLGFVLVAVVLLVRRPRWDWVGLWRRVVARASGAAG
ncbi:MAG TPA: branched-chain amino acid ABC transporter permease [Xanthobacteraceae bacterium]|jgi:branched-chain amino acid transport system permease protein|nr:branched-chain amino acid ABC transporter permease [Xanthobacteraceae bacterium]